MSAFFVTGEVSVGKSTLLQRVIEACTADREIYGFRTEKVSPAEKAGETGMVFIYPATGLPIWDAAHCVAGLWERGSYVPHSEVFETLGVELLSDIPSGAVVLMDELGFLESTSPIFREKVLDIINGDYFVLGSVKPLSCPFLDAVRKHPAVNLFEITEQNRDSVAEEMIRTFSTALTQKSRDSGDI